MSGLKRAASLPLAALLLSPLAASRQLEVDDGLDVPLARDPAPAVGPAWVLEDRIVVGYDAPAAPVALAKLATAMGGRLVRVDATLQFVVLQAEPAKQAELMKAAHRVPGVAYAKPDQRVEGFFAPNDPLYAHQWGPAAIGLPAAWNATRGSHARTVAILDTGVDGAHPDLAANFCVDGPDFINGDASSMDDHGHGTHVAGTVAAAIDNGVGVAGMADACLMAVKVLDAWGSGSFADVASGIAWAADNGANVISMSLGGCPGCDPGSPVTEAMQHAHAAGVLVVAAAGNAGCAPVSYPAAYPEAVAVAALAPPGDERASFSSCGDKVEVSAPGQDVLSTALTSGALSDPSGYMNLSGTSMATPHVSGVAALVWSHRPDLARDDLRCILAQTADDLGEPGRDPGTGFGRVDAVEALAADCVPLPPYAPQLSARARDAHVALRWSAAASFGSNVTGYNLYRGEGGDNLTLLAALGDGLSYVDLNVTNGVTYRYAVAGVNARGEGQPSSVVEATPLAPQPFSCAVANDSFGNRCETASLGFVDVRDTGTPLPPADDSLFPVDLPFAFRFYGTDYARVNVSTNGFLSFFDGVSHGCCGPQRIPTGETPNAIVAGLWADLFPVANRSITTQVVGDNGTRVAVVQFTEVPFYGYGGEARLTFQFQLHEATGAIEVHYLDADPLGERDYVAGIEDCAGMDGIEAKYGRDALVGTAVRYAPGNGTAPACAANAAPVVTLETPRDGETVSGVVNVTGTATDPDAGDEVLYVAAYYYNDTWGDGLPVNGTTRWSAQLSTSGLSGWYTLAAYAWDGSAYSPTAWSTFFVDAGNGTTPRAFIATPVDGQAVDGVVRIAGNASDADGDNVTSVTLQVAGMAEFRANGTRAWNATWDFSAFTPGTYAVRARATGDDGTGPWHEIQVVVEGDGQNHAPNVTIVTPRDGETVGRYAYVAGTAWDGDAGDAVESVYVTVDGVGQAVSGTTSWEVVLDMAWYGDGAHVITAYAWDGEAFGASQSIVVLAQGTQDDPDLAVAAEDIVVSRQRVETDLATAPNVVNERRTVSITVRNLGTRDADLARVSVWVEGETTAPRRWQVLDGWMSDVPAGGARTLTFEWDTTLNLGDVKLIVLAQHPDDRNGSNDLAQKEDWVRVGGLNVGVA